MSNCRIDIIYLSVPFFIIVVAWPFVPLEVVNIRIVVARSYLFTHPALK